MIPTALRELLASRARDLLDQPDPDLGVAEAVEDALVAISERTDLPFEVLLNAEPLVEAFGGPDYVRALLTWRTAARAWARSRRRNIRTEAGAAGRVYFSLISTAPSNSAEKLNTD
jgi:hypothetical protein